jgi:cytosine/adenosine deaminase-related metal-dependent hydrolase
MSCIEALRGGTTTVFDLHAAAEAVPYALDAIAEAVQQVGLRVCLSLAVSDRDGLAAARRAIDENVRFARRVQNNALLTAMMGLEPGMTLSDDVIKACVGAAALAGVGFHLNLAERRGDTRHGDYLPWLRSLERLARTGVLGPRTVVAHAEDVTAEGIEVLRRSRSALVHAPRAEAHGHRALLALQNIQPEGVRLCLGSDDFDLDMLAEAQGGYLLHQLAFRAHGLDGAAMMRQMLFSGNPELASAVYRQTLGWLSTGALADIVLVHHVGPTPSTRENLFRHLLMGMGGTCIDTVIIGGRVLMRHRELLTVDEGVVLARAQELGANLARRLETM